MPRPLLVLGERHVLAKWPPPPEFRAVGPGGVVVAEPVVAASTCEVLFVLAAQRRAVRGRQGAGGARDLRALEFRDQPLRPGVVTRERMRRQRDDDRGTRGGRADVERTAVGERLRRDL